MHILTLTGWSRKPSSLQKNSMLQSLYKKIYVHEEFKLKKENIKVFLSYKKENWKYYFILTVTSHFFIIHTLIYTTWHVMTIVNFLCHD